MTTTRRYRCRTPITAITAEARDVLAVLRPGETAVIPLPEGVFTRAESARRIGHVAHEILGSGRYSVDRCTDPGVARVTFFLAPRAFAKAFSGERVGVAR